MCDKNLVDKYVPDVVPKDLKWYERDSLLTYIDQLKCESFTNDPDKYLEKAEVVNFEMIHNRCRGHPRKFSNGYYQTVVQSDVKKMSQKERKKAVAACLRSERKDSFVEKKLTLSHFLGREK